MCDFHWIILFPEGMTKKVINPSHCQYWGSSNKQYSYIITLVRLSLHGFFANQQNDQLSVGLLAQLVEHCTVTAEVMGSTPVQAWFFLSFNFITTQEVFISAKITLIFIYLSAVQSYDVQNQQTHTFSVLLMLDLLTTCMDWSAQEKWS